MLSGYNDSVERGLESLEIRWISPGFMKAFALD